MAELYVDLGPAQSLGGEDCLHPNAAGHAEIPYASLARCPGSSWPGRPAAEAAEALAD